MEHELLKVLTMLITNKYQADHSPKDDNKSDIQSIKNTLTEIKATLKLVLESQKALTQKVNELQLTSISTIHVKDKPTPVYPKHPSLPSYVIPPLMSLKLGTPNNTQPMNTWASHARYPRRRYAEIEERNGDVFSHPTPGNIVHCTAEDLAMKRGFAKQVRLRFGKVDYLRSQKKKVGDVVMLPEGDRYIFYLITKLKTYDHKPDPEALHMCLTTLPTLCEDYNIKTLTMPRITAPG
jgi:hypothetical protein